MSWIDGLLVFALAAFVSQGAMQGLIRQLASLAGFLFGLILAVAFYRPLAARLATVFTLGIALEPLAFVLILFSIWITANLLAFAVRPKSSDPEQDDEAWVDPVGGALLGFASGVVMLAILAAGIVWLGWALAEDLRASYLGRWLLRIAAVLVPVLFR